MVDDSSEQELSEDMIDATLADSFPASVRHRELLREERLRFSHARQVGPDISAGRGHRSLVSALHQSKGSSTQSMV